MNKILKLVYVTLSNEVVNKLSSELSVRVTNEDLMFALIKQTGKSLEELAELDLTYELIKDIYGKSSEFKMLPRVLASIELEEGIIPEGTERSLYEQQVKHKGEVWTIHKNDVDPYPSNPHGHNYDANLSLHLGSGELYMQRRFVGKISKKSLLEIRSKISGLILPALEV